MATELQRRLFTVEEFHRMGEAGILSEDDRVELVDGEIVRMTAIGAKHAACVARVNRRFSQAAGQRIVWVQNPVRLEEHSELEPDLALLTPRADFFAAAHPGPGDVLLIVEVAETSAHYDRDVKLPLYAKARIPKAWLVDLVRSVIEIHTDPSAEGYRRVQRFERGQPISSQTCPELSILVDEILGSER